MAVDDRKARTFSQITGQDRQTLTAAYLHVLIGESLLDTRKTAGSPAAHGALTWPFQAWQRKGEKVVHGGHLWSALEQPQANGPARFPGWFPDAYETFAKKLLDQERAHPCYFGVQGQQRGNNWFTLFDSSFPEEHGVHALADSLVAFREQARRGPKRQTLIVFAGPPEPHAELADHQAAFWTLLRDLSTVDTDPWPEGYPTDTASPAWQWCFAGEPWFTFMASPGYHHRDSRNLGPCLTLVFQTRRVFDGLSGSTVAGQAAKRRIRAALEHYDTVPPHPYLGDPMYSSVHKWRQYALPDDQSVGEPEKCPFAG
ncbi:hypothetical protein GT039_15800 [Streptomyces sp. SID2955]|nr:hypothetical protein [Streptomyces sp. SID2955]